MFYLLECSCGREVVVEERQAGVEVSCECGKEISVPTYRKLKQLKPVRVESAERAQTLAVESSSVQDDARFEVDSKTKSGSSLASSSFGRLAWILGFVFLAIGVPAAFLLYQGREQVVQDQTTVEELVQSEEWILERTPLLKKLNASMLNLRLPDSGSQDLFEQQVSLVDLGPLSREPVETSLTGVGQWDWPVLVQSRDVDPIRKPIWGALNEWASYFERAKFYFVKAGFADRSREKVQATLGFEGIARDNDGNQCLIKAKIQTLWTQNPTPGEAGWRIASWETVSCHIVRRPNPMFVEVLERLIPDQELLESTRQSLHEEMLVKALKMKPEEIPPTYFSQLELSTSEHHPGLSVVDIDRDGFDDLYIMPRWGKNKLLRNRGDGTFEDVAASMGLDVSDRCTSGVFADFDNDGDPDLMLGRSMKPSLYLVNEDGKFIDRTAERVGISMPSLVFSVSAADYNNDGLLDVFFATSAVKASVEALKSILSPADSQQLEKQVQSTKAHTVLNKLGPPNLLLVNRGGGRFEKAPENDAVAGWRNTNQATWSDFDQDGDMDLYLANDFSINTMLRNDGDRFTDVTAETATADIGFGMGAAWGDFNNDQTFDLYVTNMYSKAGRRITAQIDSLDPRFADMARGNSLFEGTGNGFRKVSGLEAPSMQVEKAGWSWAGQFIDVDNNGFLDIYALSGYYTAPREVALDVDL